MFERLEPHDHTVHVYAGPRELHDALSQFTSEGLAHNQATVFVHSFSSAKEIDEFLARGPFDFKELRGKNFFVVSFYEEAFEGGSGKIDFDHVVSVVDDIVASAKSNARSGVRVFVDASRRYLAKARTEEWFAFEEKLGRQLQHNVGLVCAYERDTIDAPELRERVLRTHLYRFGA